MLQLLLHSASFNGIQSPFWSCHLLCQSIPLSPVWGPKCPSLFSKVHKNGEACSPYLYSKSQGSSSSGRTEAFCIGAGSLQRTEIYFNIIYPMLIYKTWPTVCIIYIQHYLLKKLSGYKQMAFSLNCYQHSCLRVNLYPSDPGLMHVLKQNLGHNVMDGWQSQNEFLFSFELF